MIKKTICIVTGSRADYGLLYPLIKRIKEERAFKVKIIATGMHLSPEFGLTYKEIERDGFEIDEKVEMLLSSDSPEGITKSVGLGVIGFADVLSKLSPDLVILLGDRFETFSAASAAMFLRVPIAHIHGGELTEGAIDEAIRHAITKMSHIHFTTTEEYRNRVIQLGEQPGSVYNVGALGVDNIKSIKLLSRSKLEKRLGVKFSKTNILVTFHPVTLEKNSSEKHFKEILGALDSFKEVHIIFTKPNADADGRCIVKMIDSYVAKRKNAAAFTSMGRLLYLSAMKNADILLGNSSSGIIEAPSFKVPVVNVGIRQKGRVRAESVIDVPGCKRKAIEKALKQGLSKEFRKSLSAIKNPYGEGVAALAIVKALKGLSLKDIIKKEFYEPGGER